MRIYTLSEAISFRFLYRIYIIRDLSIFRSYKYLSAIDFRALYKRKAYTSYRLRRVSRKSKSYKRYYSIYSRGSYELKAYIGFYLRNMLKESYPIFPQIQYRQKACIGSKLSTKSIGNRSTIQAFYTKVRAIVIISLYIFEAYVGLR